MKKIFEMFALFIVCFSIVSAVFAYSQYGAQYQMINQGENFNYTSSSELPTAYYVSTKINQMWGTMSFTMQVQQRKLLIFWNAVSWSQSFSSAGTFNKYVGTDGSYVTRTIWTKNDPAVGYGYMQGGYIY